jgi:abequosyltransferase
MIISICIPTFNRASELSRLILSLEKALVENKSNVRIEIIISDNASTDSTNSVVADAQVRHKNIIYSKNEKNEGYAYNINKCVNLAAGDYCWLMGSDDEVISDSINIISNHINSDIAVLVGNPITRSVERRMFCPPGEINILVQSKEKITEFLKHCREISAGFAFISTLIIKKKFWKNVQCTDFELNHPYTHMLRIYRGLATNGGAIRCLDLPIVRTGLSKNEYNATILPHFELDLVTISYIANHFCDSRQNSILIFGNIFLNQYGWLGLVKARIQATKSRWDLLVPILVEMGCSKKLLNKTIVDNILYWIYIFVKSIRKMCSITPKTM